MEKHHTCLMEKKFFIFDFDGVIVDSTRLGFKRFNLILKTMGLPAISDDFLRQHWGMKMEEIIDLICNCAEVGASQEEKEAFKAMEPGISSSMPYKLEREMLEALLNLRISHIDIGLITSRTDKSLTEISNLVGLSLKTFNKIQTLNHFYHYKPDGRVFGPFINWAKSRGIEPEQIVYIGDTIQFDLAATLDSDPKIDFIGVVSGVNTREDFLQAGVPMCRIVDFENLPDFLHKIAYAKGNV